MTWPRARYERALHAIAEIDPAGLVALGCPEDEYEPELARLIPLVPVTPEHVQAVFRDMLDEEFGTVTATQAHEIADAINRARPD